MGNLILTIVLFGCGLQLTCSSGNSKEIPPVRPIQNGDILTPTDFLPVARKLLEKAEYPGVGKGIVSSSKTYQQLADKLFQRFFFTNARFSIVRLFDMSGLDSLQALALSGDDFMPSRQFIPLQRTDFMKVFAVRCRYKLMTKKIEEKKIKVKKIEEKKNAKRSHKKATTDTKKSEKRKYKTVKTSHLSQEKNTKTVVKKKLIIRPVKRHRPKREAAVPNSTSAAAPTSPNGRKNSPRVIPQAKKLSKNRMLVVKSKRKKRDTVTAENSKANNKKIIDTKRHGNRRVTAPYLATTAPPIKDDEPGELFALLWSKKMKYQPSKKIDKEKCYWRYKCPEEKVAFFTCELYPECENTTSDHFIRDDIPIAHAADEHDSNFLRFRKEVGVYLVDEEVEKIFEHRYLLLITPPKGPPQKGQDQKEQVGQQPPGQNLEKKYGAANLQFYFQNLILAERATSTMAPEIKDSKENNRRKNEHIYKYLKAKNTYSDAKMKKQIKEAQMKKLQQEKERQKDEKLSAIQQNAVISLSMAVTTPLPDFMHQMKK